MRLKFEENHSRFHTPVTSKTLLTMFLCTFLGVPRGIPPVKLKLLWAFFVSSHMSHVHFIAHRFHYFQMKDCPFWFCLVLCSYDISSPTCYCRTLHTKPEGSPERTTNCGPLHTLKTEAVCFAEILVLTYQTVQNNMNHHGRRSLKPYEWRNREMKIFNVLTFSYKVKAKVFLAHHMKGRGNRGMAPLILKLRTRWKWVVSFTPRPH